MFSIKPSNLCSGDSSNGDIPRPAWDADKNILALGIDVMAMQPLPMTPLTVSAVANICIGTDAQGEQGV